MTGRDHARVPAGIQYRRRKEKRRLRAGYAGMNNSVLGNEFVGADRRAQSAAGRPRKPKRNTLFTNSTPVQAKLVPYWIY